MVLSLLVVTIHTHLFPEVLNPLARTAVPLFFMLSSFFFFGRAGNLKKLWARNMCLYGFWFVILLPVTLKIRHYFTNGFLKGILSILQNFVFYSTFRSSWYIVALCTAMTIVYYITKKISNKTLLALSVPIYLLYCLFSNYYNLLARFDCWVDFCMAYKGTFITLCNNFPVAFIWLVLGKMFAEKEITLSPKTSWFLLVISIILLIAEQVIILYFDLAAATDCYICLVPVCIAVFSLLQQVKCSFGAAPVLRKMATITYVLHSSAIVLVDVIAKKVLQLQGSILAVVEFVGAVLTCAIVTLLILYLEKHRGFRWLKWAY